jgi:hypothetical protein
MIVNYPERVARQVSTRAFVGTNPARELITSGLHVTRQESGKLAAECEFAGAKRTNVLADADLAKTESSVQQRLNYFFTGASASYST